VDRSSKSHQAKRASMMRALILTIALCSVSAAGAAQSASETAAGLQACFQSARRADTLCADPANDPAQRLGCLQQAHAAQLECLRQVMPDAAATAESTAPERTAAIGTSQLPLAKAADKPAPAAAPDRPAKAIESPATPRDTNWVMSETTSPVDYAPLLTAAIRLPFTVKHAPNILAIRCRAGRTELVVRTGGTWRASRAGEIQIEYQVDDQPAVKLPWMASADRKTAIYRDDPVGLLQSLPESARLRISVLDAPDPSHDATFQLTGLDSVREKIATACKWSPVTARVTSEKR
jgi:hypothetical protein